MSSYLYKLIQQGEHQEQDFKFCITDSKKIARSLVAFANTKGGRLLVGVKDNGKIAGVRSEEEYYMVEGAASIYSKPQIKFSSKQWNVEGKTVLEIDVAPSPDKPHFAQDENGKWIAYTRKDDENLMVNRIQVEVWKKEKSPDGIYIYYSKDEKFLVDYLFINESITLSKYVRLALISRQKAIEILSNFVLMKIINMESLEGKTVFSLNQEFDKEELKKFR
ncbi:MAG: ATP-binding protein [Prolixibacteraceae bacterium]|nr:ATP-binding protein [Prolixibacteraceae bacterium]